MSVSALPDASSSSEHPVAVDLESNNPPPANGNRHRLGQHAQTHIRLASFSNTSPSVGSILSSFSPASSGGNSGSFKNAARSFFHGSYHNGKCGLKFISDLVDPISIPAHPASYVRDYTAEIASLALENEESAQQQQLSPLPPAIAIPPLSSQASSSTLTALIRSASNTYGDNDLNNPLSASAARFRRSGAGASVTIGGDSGSDSSDPASPVVSNEVSNVSFSDSSTSARSDRTSSFYNSDRYGNDDEEVDQSHPLLPRSSNDIHGSSRVQYGSEFTFEDSNHKPSRAGSWLRRFGTKRTASNTSIRSGLILASDDSDTESVSDRLIHRSKPVIRSTGTYLLENKGKVLSSVKYLPSVVLGLLLNVLDGLSYGMILFPLGEPLFSSLGPEGLSMFYVSCIVSQLVYSFGGSAFKGGVGSEMIEVVPFFHSMAYTLLARIGEDKPDSVLATTILAYAISSIVTGAVFFGLGFAKIGSLIGFFPRHILVGCIGGVGWFLIATGLEVSSRLEGNLAYNLETAQFLLRPTTLMQWGIPLVLAIFLIMLEHLVKHPLLVPGYFILVLLAFHSIVSLVPGLSLQMLRDSGWIFASPAASAPWYSFYRLYKFSAVDWPALISTIPAMFALTFFGILHVPINVPALAVSVGEDNVDVDRELIAHGISNALSGLCGSIQNYLVYTNSLLFIRSGADSRVAGFMLALATTAVMVAGPGVIGFIPVMVVGALIFLLGIELMREALYDTWGRVNRFEYFVIVTIIISMGAWDFVYGIIVGIILACISFVIESSRKSAIKATYSGAVARSTVRRHPFQQRFLKEVGDEIFVCRLTGFLFFGTIVSVESKIREVILSAHSETSKTIKYLVLDFQGVGGVDFSAAEAFTRMKRLLETKQVELILCSLSESAASGLKAVGLWEVADNNNGVHVFEDLNSGLEWCENELLAVYYQVREFQKHKLILESTPAQPIADVVTRLNSSISQDLMEMSSPRKSLVKKASSNVMLSDPTFSLLQSIAESAPANDTAQKQTVQQAQPQALLLQVIHDFSSKPAEFWSTLCSFFVREEHSSGTVLYHRLDDAEGFYIVESGILKAEYDLDQGRFSEAIVAGTTAGELPFFSETKRTAKMVVERDAVVWKLGRLAWARFLSADGLSEDELRQRRGVAIELYKVAMKLTAERFNAITAYVLTSAH